MNAPTDVPVPAGDDSARPVDGIPTRCVWCGEPLDASGQRLAGRIGCRACGSATTSPWPDDAALAGAYGGWYRPAEGGRRFALAGDAILGRTRGLLAARLDAIAPPGPILDVGAGDGTLLDALAARGRTAIGLERDAGRADLRDEPIESIEGDGEWAAVVFWHSLEHLPRPGAAIREAARLLARGGVIVVAVPNGSSLQARAFGDRWLHLDLPRHLVHLRSDGLCHGLGAAGFAIGRVSHARGGQIVIGWLDGLVGLLPGDLDLYQSLRRPEAQRARLPRRSRLLSVPAGVVLLPAAALLAVAEIGLRRGGTVYVEGRRV